jgi:hypothetical protein
MTKVSQPPATSPPILITGADADSGVAQYTNALAMGYTFSSTTPDQVPVNPAQPNPNTPVEQP